MTYGMLIRPPTLINGTTTELPLRAPNSVLTEQIVVTPGSAVTRLELPNTNLHKFRGTTRFFYSIQPVGNSVNIILNPRSAWRTYTGGPAFTGNGVAVPAGSTFTIEFEIHWEGIPLSLATLNVGQILSARLNSTLL
jgi:hypothetical protein